ncbi:MAG: hypothetical protein C0412_19285, partial [Flavobacterium sp.]|nr:hypothetical protein [Flavobacterium sp.]
KSFLDKINLKILDVGARGGPLSQFEVLAPFSHLFICEPDTEEAKRVGQALSVKAQWKRVTPILEALYSRGGEARLNIVQTGGLSSLLEFNESETKNYHTLRSWNNANIVCRVPVLTLTLDDAAVKYGFNDLSLIKIDTQGTELDILKSGSEIILPSLLAVYIEVEFVPLYKNQPLFSEVDNFLESNGFRIMDFQRVTLRRKTLQKIPYSKRELSWAHILYFKKRNPNGGPLRAEQKARLAAIALAFEYFDYAVWLLEQTDVQEYLKSQNFEGLDKEFVSYVKFFWRSLGKKLNWRRRRQISDTIRSDARYER